MTFKVGDKIVRTVPHDLCEKNKVFTVDWCSSINPKWITVKELGNYSFNADNFKLYEAPKPHKWAKEIIAWANGAQIECRTKLNSGDWTAWCTLFQTPKWHTSTEYEYRIKPEKKPDFHSYGYALAGSPSVYVHAERHKHEKDNVQFTFDGETGKLKAVELIN